MMSACNAERIKIVVPTTGVKLIDPVEGVTMDLSEMSGSSSLTFSWGQEIPSGAVLFISTSPTLNDATTLEAGVGSSFSMTVAEFDLLMGRIGISSGETGIIYWSVKPSDNLLAASDDIFSMNVVRLASRLKSPKDQSSIELLADNPEMLVSFAWDNTELGISDITICFSLEPSVTQDVAELKKEANGTISLTAEELQGVMEKVTESRFTTSQVFWNIKDNATGEFISPAPGTLFIKDMLRFVDIRGDEKVTYGVAEINIDGEIQYWTARNLMTEYAADGTPLVRGTEYQYCNDEELFFCADEAERTATKQVYGYYYTLEAAKKATPAGWKIPSYSEYEALFAAARAAGTLSVLKDPVYYIPAVPKLESIERLGEWGLNLCSAGQWWGGSSYLGGVACHSEHMYLVCTECPEQGGAPSNYFVHSSLGDVFWPQGGPTRGASVRFIYTGK